MRNASTHSHKLKVSDRGQKTVLTSFPWPHQSARRAGCTESRGSHARLILQPRRWRELPTGAGGQPRLEGNIASDCGYLVLSQEKHVFPKSHTLESLPRLHLELNLLGFERPWCPLLWSSCEFSFLVAQLFVLLAEVSSHA